MAGLAARQLRFVYYPTLTAIAPNLWQCLLFAAFAALCGMPLFLHGKEALARKHTQSTPSASKA